MTDRLLYHMPGSCSRVVLIALEESGLPYREQSVALLSGAQRQPGFLAVNPKGKVPVLVEDGVVVTEAPVILHHLAGVAPEAGLLPSRAGGRIDLAALSDLVWIAGALHGASSRMFRPTGFSEVDPQGVSALGREQMAAHAADVSQRLADRDWWYGDRWSITDTFLAWVFALVAQVGFPLADFPALAAHRARAEARPAFQRARALEQAIAARDGLVSPPGFSL